MHFAWSLAVWIYIPVWDLVAFQMDACDLDKVCYSPKRIQTLKGDNFSFLNMLKAFPFELFCQWITSSWIKKEMNFHEFLLCSVWVFWVLLSRDMKLVRQCLRVRTWGDRWHHAFPDKCSLVRKILSKGFVHVFYIKKHLQFQAQFLEENTLILCFYLVNAWMIW